MTDLIEAHVNHRALFAGPRTFEFQDVAPSAPGPGELQIAVAYTGICGTDLHIVVGNMAHRVPTKRPIGHEMSGVISAVGSDVQGWATGQHVTVMPLDADGTCPACKAGHGHICPNLNFIGIDSEGALQTYWNVAAETVLALPEDLDLRTAALVEPVAVAVHDVHRGGVKAGDKCVIFGGGPIGLLIALVIRSFDGEVLLVEPHSGRQEMARSLGIQVVEPDVVADRIAEWTGGAGADVAFEVSSAAPAVTAAVEATKVRGTVVIVAIHGEERAVNLHRVLWRELHVVGARVYERTDFEEAIRWLQANGEQATKLITKEVPLDNVAEAFEALGRSEGMKILVRCGEDAK